jgi:hypothetical protein
VTIDIFVVYLIGVSEEPFKLLYVFLVINLGVVGTVTHAKHFLDVIFAVISLYEV